MNVSKNIYVNSNYTNIIQIEYFNLRDRVFFLTLPIKKEFLT